jgi:hypothetical protein
MVLQIFLEALHALTVPSAHEVANDPSLKAIQGKNSHGSMLPPFLMKTLIDINSEDPFKLFKAACKALNNYER